MNATDTQGSLHASRCSGPKPEDILKLIVDVGKAEIAKQSNCNDPYGEWKLAVYRALAQKFAPSGSGMEAFYEEADRKEFVLDFVLAEAQREQSGRQIDIGHPKNIVRATFGLEIEWTVGTLDASEEFDFNKMLCFRAPLKGFVYTCNKARDRKKFSQSIEPCLKTFKQHTDGDEYLILEYYKENRTWQSEPPTLFRVVANEVTRVPLPNAFAAPAK
jgi:hypothetical protein